MRVLHKYHKADLFECVSVPLTIPTENKSAQADTTPGPNMPLFFTAKHTSTYYIYRCVFHTLFF